MKKTCIFVSIIMLLISFISIYNNSTDLIFAYSVLDDITAKSYIVIDQSGNVLIEKNCDDKKEVASICKLMTTLLTLEKIESGDISLDTKFVVSQKASDAEGSQAFLDAGSSYTVRDLLKSVIVASANDSAIVLAEGIAGSENNFVKLMNEKARTIGMNNTLYNNSTGLPALEQYSTARDTAKLLNVVSSYDIYKEDCGIWMDKLVHPSGRITELVNTNRLIKYYEYCLTGKTGFTDEAGYCLSSTAEKEGLKLTCVVLGCNSSANRFKESIELYNYCYANYKNDKVLSQDLLINNNIKVLNGKSKNIEVKVKNDFYFTQNRTVEKDVKIKYNLPESIKAPIQKGEIVGSAWVIVDGEIVSDIPLVANNTIEKQEYRDIISKVVENFGFIR